MKSSTLGGPQSEIVRFETNSFVTLNCKAKSKKDGGFRVTSLHSTYYSKVLLRINTAIQYIEELCQANKKSDNELQYLKPLVSLKEPA